MSLAAPPAVVVLGETMLMFAPPRYELMEHCDQFGAFIGGSEVNVAVGLERLGLRSGWIGKLPDNALGRKVLNGVRAYGVDTRACILSQTGRVGLFFIEWAPPPRPLKTVYDRADSAATTLTCDEIDWDYLQGVTWFHLTGITPALSEICHRETGPMMRQAHAAGCKVSFDLNYRSLLWPPTAARQAFDELLPLADLITATESDARLLLQTNNIDRETMLQTIFERYRPQYAVLTLSNEGSLGFDGQQFYRSSGHAVHIINRLGAGDAFAAGLLYGLTEYDLAAGLQYGSAMAALKLTIPQNMPLIDRADVARLLQQQSLDLLR